MAIGAVSSIAVKDGSAATKTLSKVTDPNNSSYLAPRVCIDDALVTTPMYAAGANQFSVDSSLPATISDVIEIAGSATKTVRVKKLVISGRATTAAQWAVTLVKRVAAHSDGTWSTPSIVAYDHGSATASAVVRHATAHGTAIAADPASSVLDTREMMFTTATTVPGTITFDFSKSTDQCPILRGAAQTLCVALTGTIAGNEKMSYSVTWSEDAS